MNKKDLKSSCEYILFFKPFSFLSSLPKPQLTSTPLNKELELMHIQVYWNLTEFIFIKMGVRTTHIHQQLMQIPGAV